MATYTVNVNSFSLTPNFNGVLDNFIPLATKAKLNFWRFEGRKGAYKTP